VFRVEEMKSREGRFDPWDMERQAKELGEAMRDTLGRLMEEEEGGEEVWGRPRVFLYDVS